MSRLAPRGHTADSRELLTCVTSHRALRLVTNCTGNCEQGRACTCVPREMARTAGGEPTIPRRSLPTKPRLSPMRRLVLWLTRLSASIRRT
jgi:hypothetical protein